MVETRGSLTARAREIARLMDSAFRVPGTKFRFGLDPVLGLVPGLGDVIGGSFSAYVLWLAFRAGAPAPVLGRMMVNAGFDVLFGAIPLLGDLLDAGYKANLRNLALLEQFVEHPEEARRRSKLFFVVVAVGLILVFVAAIWLAVAVVGAIF